ncbi:MAG: hypothetical protein IKJ27_10530 [Clostridia bacterium]|nr:hypothetical protein [Clostridia bacterium]
MAYEISADWVKNTDENTTPFLGAESNHEDFRSWETVVKDIFSCVLNTEDGMRVAFVCAEQQDCEILGFACRTFIDDCFRHFGGHSTYKEEFQEIESYFSNSCLFIPLSVKKSTDIYDEIYKIFSKLLTHRYPKYKIKSKPYNKTLAEAENNFCKQFNSFKDDILEKLSHRDLLFKYISLANEQDTETQNETTEKADISKIKTPLCEMEKTVFNIIEKFISIYGKPSVIFFLVFLPIDEYESITNESVLFPGFAKLAIKCETLPYEKNINKDISKKENTLYNNEEENETTEFIDIEKNDQENDKKVVDCIQEDLYSESNSVRSMRKDQYKDPF